MRKSDKPFIIPVFIPHQGCPHQCVFCNQFQITGTKKSIPPSSDAILSEIDRFLGYNKDPERETQIAFYGGNFLGLEKSRLIEFLDIASNYVQSGKVKGIRFSTRPETINDEILTFLDDYPVATIELGVQSMDDQVLSLSNRGHTRSDTLRAVSCLKQYDFEIGMQMMVGLPGDDEEKSLTTGHAISELLPDFVRIYPAVVLDKSPLAVWFRQGKYVPLSLSEGIKIVKKLYLLFMEKGINVIRMGLQADTDLEDDAVMIAGPYHPAFGQLVISELFLDMARLILEKASMEDRKAFKENLAISVHPRNVSNIRGQKNNNIDMLKHRYGISSVTVLHESQLDENTVEIGPFSLSLAGDVSEISEFVSSQPV